MEGKEIAQTLGTSNKVNLCDSCRDEQPECAPDNLIFGDGKGMDNVICCDAYRPFIKCKALINELKALSKKFLKDGETARSWYKSEYGNGKDSAFDSASEDLDLIIEKFSE